MLALLLASLLVGIILNREMIVRVLAEPGERVGMPILSNRTDVGDNYHYYIAIKAGPETCSSTEHGGFSLLGGTSIACSYYGGLVVGHLTQALAAIVSPDIRFVPAVTIILNTALLAFGLLLLIRQVIGREIGAAAAIAIAGLALIFLDNFSTSLLLGRLDLNPATYFGRETNSVRVMSPTLSFAVGLVSLATVIGYLRQPTQRSLAIAAGFAVLPGLTSIAVGGTLLAGLGLFVCLETLRRRTIPYPPVLIGVGYAVGLGISLMQLKLFWATEIGHGLMHGQSKAIELRPWVLLLLIPALTGRISPDGGPRDHLMKCVLLAAIAIGLLCESVELGSRLWTRGAAIFAFVAVLCWAYVMVTRRIVPFLEGKLQGRPALLGLTARFSPAISPVVRLAALLVVAGGLGAAMTVVKPSNAASWRGHLDREKYDALEWLDREALPGSVVASTNLEDSYLIAIYTGCTPYVPLFGLSGASLSEIAERYFAVAKLIGALDARRAAVLGMTERELKVHSSFLMGAVAKPFDYETFQAIAFYKSLVYFPYNRTYSGVFRSPEAAEPMRALVEGAAERAKSKSADFSYLVMRTGEQLANAGDFVEVFRNASYRIVRPRLTEAAPSPTP